MKVQRTLRAKQLTIVNQKQLPGRNSRVSDLVRSAHDRLDMSQRHYTVDFFSTIKSANFHPVSGGFFFQLSNYEENGKITLVPKSQAGIKKAELTTQHAPKKADFLNKECFVLIFENYAIVVSQEISDSLIEKYLTDILFKAGQIDKDQKLEMHNIANADTVEKIRKYGVKSIEIKARIDAGGWAYTRPQYSELPVSEKIKIALGYAFAMDTDISPDRINDYRYDLKITDKGKLDAVEDVLLESAAIGLYNEDQSSAEDNFKYSIVLKEGQGRLNSNTITVNETVYITKMGSSLDYENVKQECLAYRERLIKRHVVNDKARDKAA